MAASYQGAIISCEVGDDFAGLRTKIYEDLGWMPYLRQGSVLIQQRKNEHLGKVSDRDVGDLENCPTTVLIEPETSLWCLASEITRGRVIFQVFGDNIQLLEEACERLVIDRPVAAEAHGISQLRFSPRIQVREDRSALMSAVGRINQLELLTFFQFLSRRRRKEQAVLLSSFVLAAILGVSSYWSPRILWLDTHAGYWHGLLDRIGSALVVATIILLLNLFIDWRAARRPSNAIDWSIAS